MRKVYYYADYYKEQDWREWMRFVWQDWSRIHWAWGWKEANKVKYIIRKLIEIHGDKIGFEIYKKYNEALLAIKDDNQEWKFPTASLVLRREDFEGRHDKKNLPSNKNNDADKSTLLDEKQS